MNTEESLPLHGFEQGAKPSGSRLTACRDDGFYVLHRPLTAYSHIKTAEKLKKFLRYQKWRECVGIEPTKRGVSTQQRV